MKNVVFSALIFISLLATGCNLGQQVPSTEENETALAISSPTNNQKVYNPIMVEGSYYDALNVSSIKIYCTPVYGGVTNVVSAQVSGSVLHPFSAQMSNAIEGFCYIWAVAVNQNNQITTSQHILIDSKGSVPDTNNYDFTPPVSVILSPTNNSIVSSSFSVSGNASDDKSGIKLVWLDVDGAGFQVVSQTAGLWQTNINLSLEGDHTISTFASDRSNNISLTNSIVVNYLASLPSILLSSPANNKIVKNSSINISGTATVSSGTISLVQVKINGGSYVNASGTSSWSLNGAALGTQGTNIIFIRAISSTQVTNVISSKVILDSVGPNVTISAPVNNALITSLPLSFNGTASDTTTWVSNVRVSLDDVNYISASGTGTWTSSPAVLQGSNTLYVYSVDAAGNNSGVSSVNIVVDTIAPQLSVDTIPTTVNNPSLTVSGTAQDQSTGVAAVYVSLNNASYQAATGTTTWTKSLTLQNGANTIKICAVDNAGHKSATNSYSVSLNNTSALTVYFKLPAGWSTPSLYFYQSIPTNVTTTWATAPAMTNAGNGWYKISLSLEKARIIFKDGTYQLPPAQSPGMLVTNTTENYYWTNSKWYSENPETPVDLSCSIITPANNSKTTLTNITISGSAYAVSSLTAVYVSLNNGSFVQASGTSSWSYGATLVVGTNTIRAYAVGNGGDYSETNTVRVIRREGGSNPYPGTYSGRKGAWLYSDGVEFSTFWTSAGADKVYVAGDFSGWKLKPLTNIGNSVWVGFVPGVTAGANYKMVGVKGIVTNWVQDIYGAYTHGDLGNSIVVDHSEFNWEDTSWTRPGWDYYSIYEINVNEFSAGDTSLPASKRGTYLGMAEKMQYLADLGITCIELMPVTEFGGDAAGWGYNPAIFTSPESSYGTQPFIGYETINEFKALVNEAHKKGIAVVLDMVFNHTGGSNPFWFMDKTLYFDWNNDGVVQANPGQPDNSPWGNHFCNWRSQVENYAKEVLEYWITEYHVDGFRYDASYTDYVADSFIRSIKSYLEPKYPNVMTIVESVPVQSLHNSKGPQWSFIFSKNGEQVMTGGLGVASPNYNNYNQSFMDNLNAGITGSTVTYSSSPWHVVNYFDSHDEKSLAAYLYNHGDSATAVQWKSRLAIATLVAAKGFPMFYGGQEFGNDRDTPNEGQAGRTDLRPLNWSTYTANQSAIYNYYSGMLTLRKNHPALRNFSANADLVYGENNNCVGYRFAKSGDNTFVIFLNYGGDKSSFSLNSLGSGTWKLVASPTTFIGEGSTQTYTQWDTINFNGSSALVFMQ